MQNILIVEPKLKEIVSYLQPASNYNVSLARILEKEINHELAIYEVMDKNFQTKYKMNFEKFYKTYINKKPTFSIEQDYFDWELAITQIKTLHKKLSILMPISK